MKNRFPFSHPMPSHPFAAYRHHEGAPYGRDPYGHHAVYPPGGTGYPPAVPHGYPYADAMPGNPHTPYNPHYGQAAADDATPDYRPSTRLLKGALVGAAAAYLLTNDNVQQTAIRSIVKLWHITRGGVEELKERFQDAHAEIISEKE